MQTATQHRPTWIEIDLDHLVHNYRAIRSFIGEHVLFLSVVKADAYGHSAVECARELEKAGTDWFGVAIPEEAIELRDAGIKAPILSLGGFWAGQEDAIIARSITPVVYHLAQCKRLNAAATARGVTVNVHLKVDTGMGRLGVPPESLEEFLQALRQLGSLRLDGLMTHFAAADDLSEVDFTQRQIFGFEQSLKLVRKYGFEPTFTDLANSPGAIVHKNAVNQMVRIGGLLYGLGDDILPSGITKPSLKPVLSLFSRIGHIKTVESGESIGYGRSFVTNRRSVIATIPIGYHDGYPRVLSNRGKVLIRGQFVPVVGRVSMDWILADVTDVPDVSLEDLVTIIGEDNGLVITAADIASSADTIAYEITCGLNRRISRIYDGST